MKVNGPNGVGSAAAPRGAARGAAGGFALPNASGAARSRARGRHGRRTMGVGSIDALLALQEVGGPLERRRKAVRRAGVILDVLDEVKLALLDGGVPPAALERLMSAVRLEQGGDRRSAPAGPARRNRDARGGGAGQDRNVRRARPDRADAIGSLNRATRFGISGTLHRWGWTL